MHLAQRATPASCLFHVDEIDMALIFGLLMIGVGILDVTGALDSIIRFLATTRS